MNNIYYAEQKYGAQGSRCCSRTGAEIHWTLGPAAFSHREQAFWISRWKLKLRPLIKGRAWMQRARTITWANSIHSGRARGSGCTGKPVWITSNVTSFWVPASLDVRARNWHSQYISLFFEIATMAKRPLRKSLMPVCLELLLRSKTNCRRGTIKIHWNSNTCISFRIWN